MATTIERDSAQVDGCLGCLAAIIVTVALLAILYAAGKHLGEMKVLTERVDALERSCAGRAGL